MSLIAYRKWIAEDEDDSLHVMDAEIGIVAQQEIVGRKLESIDRWGKALMSVATEFWKCCSAIEMPILNKGEEYVVTTEDSSPD